MRKIPTEVYSRVVGYYRPVGQWNKGKQAEFGDRLEASVNNLENMLTWRPEAVAS